MEETVREKIERLKKEKDVVILAHYYVDGEVQALADYVGDSFYLSKVATKVTQQNILFCGVQFMGESAKILNPEKNVVMADDFADCPMAHMVTKEKIAEVRAQYDDLAVVCYVNSTAEIKTVSDVCVTSSNAVKVVKNIEAKNIFFVPDNNLGRYVSKMVPEKNFIFHDGFCHVHKSILAENVKANIFGKLSEGLYSAYVGVGSVRKNAYVITRRRVGDYFDGVVVAVAEFEGQPGERLIVSQYGEVFYEPELRERLSKLRNVLSEETIEKAAVPLKRMLELAAK